jgi:GTP-binding protein EngB required for normal cell division
LVLTKADELKASERATVIEAASREAVKHTAALRDVQLTSALKGEGIADLRTHLAALAQ